jgi:hypothetical protein
VMGPQENHVFRMSSSSFSTVELACLGHRSQLVHTAPGMLPAQDVWKLHLTRRAGGVHRR